MLGEIPCSSPLGSVKTIDVGFFPHVLGVLGVGAVAVHRATLVSTHWWTPMHRGLLKVNRNMLIDLRVRFGASFSLLVCTATALKSMLTVALSRCSGKLSSQLARGLIVSRKESLNE